MELHIVRIPETPENQITREDWLACIDADEDIQRKEGDDIPEGWIVVTIAGAEEWETLSWRRGSASAAYPQKAMMSKMMDLAERLSAVVMTDDGIVFTRGEDGRITSAEF